MPSRFTRYKIYAAFVPIVAAILLVVYWKRPKEKPIDPPEEKDRSVAVNPNPVPPVEPKPKESEYVLIKLSRTGGNEVSERQEIETGATKGTLILKFDMYLIPDRLVVVYDDVKLHDTGLVQHSGTISLNYGPGKSTKLLILLNEGRNQPGTTWELDGRIIPGHHLAPDTFVNPNSIPNPKGVPAGKSVTPGAGQFGNLGGQFGTPSKGTSKKK